jgi:RNA polymerase sigma factor (sigma-70 family)
MTNYTKCTDEALIAACREGSEAAWNSLVGRYERLVYTIPLRYGLSHSEADDVFQAVWVVLLKHLHTLEQPDRLSAWLVTTAKRECWNSRRGADYDRTTVVPPESMPEKEWPHEEETEAIVGRFEQHQALEQLLKELDDRCRQLLYYLYYDPQKPSYEEIGRYLDMPIGAIGPTRTRCLQKLQALMEDDSRFKQW